MNMSLCTTLRSSTLRSSVPCLTFNKTQQPLSLPARMQVARLCQFSNSIINKKVESIILSRRLVNASSIQKPPVPLQSGAHSARHMAMFLFIMANGGLMQMISYNAYLIDFLVPGDSELNHFGPAKH